jgi:calcineurin-like phosphoesterase family protein
MKNFVISDTHFSHKNIIKYCNRPFQHIDEMNETLIKNWNDVVGKDDRVFHLGDFAFERDLNRLAFLRSRLNGRIILIRGNHDEHTDDDYKLAGFDEVYRLYDENIHNSKWVFSHYQMTTWNCSHKGSFHLFGHEHWQRQYDFPHEVYKKNFWSERKFNVCADSNNFTPINLLTIKNILEKRDFNSFQR